MRPSRHLALSTAAGGALWAVTGQPWALPVTVGAGVAVDIDHGPDLWWTLALGRTPVATFVLHAWEWLVGLLLVGVWLGFPWWLVAVCIGYGLHVITDHLFNHGRLWTYSLVYRARHRFRMACMASEWDPESSYEVLEKEVPIAAWLIEWWKHRSVRSRQQVPSEEGACKRHDAI